MSASAKTPASTGSAPWRSLFHKHISEMPSPEFVFTTLEAAPSAPVPFVPRARTCIFRGMWAELPENKHNTAPRNEHVYESDLLTLTTDVRMGKVPQIMSSCRGHGGIEESQGSGGGGPVEAMFWIDSVKTQWRFQGLAYIVARDIETGNTSGTSTVKHEVAERMRVVREEGKAEWSWGKELTGHFGNLNPGMRGSFKNPPPGTPVEKVPGGDLRLGQKVEDLEDETARANFRVIIIRPDVVEQLDLTDPEHGRRWKYTFVGQDGDAEGEWRKEELWP